MNSMQYYSPNNLDEYQKIYSGIADKNTLVFSGGTDLMVVRHELSQDAVIIDISGIAELKGIDKKEDKIFIGSCTTLNELFSALRKNLSLFDEEIASIDVKHGPNRAGDIPHSMASIEKAKTVLGYDPEFDAAGGFRVACEWYFENIR